MGIEINGLGVFLAKLDELGGNIDKALLDGTKRSTAIVQKSAKEGCPVDLGQLRASIMRDHEVKMNVITGKVTTDVEYSAYVEYGTGLYTTKGTGRQTPWRYQLPDGNWVTTHGNKPQPYMYPALINNREQILKAYEWGILREIKKVGNK